MIPRSPACIPTAAPIMGPRVAVAEPAQLDEEGAIGEPASGAGRDMGSHRRLADTPGPTTSPATSR